VIPTIVHPTAEEMAREWLPESNGRGDDRARDDFANGVIAERMRLGQELLKSDDAELRAFGMRLGCAS